MSTITVTNIGKAYKLYPTRWSRLIEWLDPRGKPRHELKWILQEINFHIQQGEAVGVIGINGAGKSTLLKMITGTTQPTTGSININGRVTAMLELGMGFHPDFTGRQNAFMAGQLAGLSESELVELMPGIEQFANVGEYFDQPVRTYSSGMQARVAFSVATATAPDILIVDEALSVGDMAFQAKCMQRMNAMLQQGTTILFVSHGLNQIRQFCNKALYLSNGLVKAWGPVDEVCDIYQNDLSGAGQLGLQTKQSEQSAVSTNTYSRERNPQLRKNSVGGEDGGTMDLEFLDFQVIDIHGNPVGVCRSGDLLRFQAIIHANKDVPAGANVGLLVADKSGYHLMACNTNFYDKYLPAMRKDECALVEWEIRFPFSLGELRIDIGIKPDPFSELLYDRVFCAAMLTVVPEVELLKRNFGGYIFLDDVKINISTKL